MDAIEPTVADTFSVETLTERHNFQVKRRETDTDPDAAGPEQDHPREPTLF